MSNIKNPKTTRQFDDFSERAGDSSESAGDNGKEYNQGFPREHVTLYPWFVRQWGLSGCQRSSEWCFL